MKNIRITQESANDYGNKIYELAARLYPICRSITGNGNRETLNIIKEYIPIEIKEVPTGQKAFDWEVPKEWNINDAYVKNSKGEKVIDFQKSNLHVLNYSIPVRKKMSLEELKKNLFKLDDYPDWIPYLTSYYNENWGFCLSKNEYEKLEDDEYEVFIDSNLEDGCLTYGEYFIKGETDKEILFSTYICHPSMANDNLSGVTMLTYLAKYLSKIQGLKYSYRFLFIPETIGAITWLSVNEHKLKNIQCGMVATCVGDSGMSTYKKSKNGNSIIDRIVQNVLKHSNKEYRVFDFYPWGSDERQFSSPGINIDMGSLMRTPYGVFPEYHTSADNMDFIKPESLGDSFKDYISIIDIIENDATYINLNPKCEPQLGRRGLYDLIGSIKYWGVNKFAILWVLNLSEGKNSLLDISTKSEMPFYDIRHAADLLYEANLLKEI